MPINGRSVPGIVYNLNRRIRGLTDSSHAGLNNFLPTRSPPLHGREGQKWSFLDRKKANNGRTVPGRVYVPIGGIRGLNDNSHVGLKVSNNF